MRDRRRHCDSFSMDGVGGGGNLLPMASELHVFCYDVGTDRARRRVSDRLAQFGVRVQRSVFEARLPRGVAQNLARRCARDLEPGDSLKVYVVTDGAVGRCLAYGAALAPESGDFVLA